MRITPWYIASQDWHMVWLLTWNYTYMTEHSLQDTMDIHLQVQLKSCQYYLSISFQANSIISSI